MLLKNPSKLVLHLSQTTADNANEAIATGDSHEHAQVHHLGLRTSDWTRESKIDYTGVGYTRERQVR